MHAVAEPALSVAAPTPLGAATAVLGMDYETWVDRLESTTVTVDDHDLEVAYYDEGSGEPVVFCTAFRRPRTLARRRARSRG